MIRTLLATVCIITFFTYYGCETARGVGQDIRSAASTIGSVLSVGRQIEDISN